MKRGRVAFLKFCLFVAILTILARLFYVQIIQHDYYVAKASEEHVSENVIVANRGKIYMMDGQKVVPVVLNEAVYTVIFDPTIVDKEKSREIFEKYAKENLVADFETIFSDPDRRYFVVAKGVEYEKAKKLVEELSQAEVGGIYFEKTNKRVYPEGELGASVLGFVNDAGEGQYGIEEALDKELAGKDGSLKALRDVNGVVLSIGDENIETPAVDGEDIVLSIDRNIESKVGEILAKHLENSIATNVSAIVMNPRDGRVLAMVDLPGFNPEKYSEVEDISLFKNKVVKEPYEAASVCKTFAFATAIDLGVMNAETTYYNEGEMTVDGLTFQNAYQGLYGTISMQQALNYSFNTGSATALKLISGGGEINLNGRERFYDYLQKFRLGRETGIELFEDLGTVPKPDDESEYALNFRYANMTFGQGMALTMAQIASAFAGIINDGVYHQPSVVAGKMEGGNFVKKENEEAGEQIVSLSTSAQMREMLYGTRNNKRINGIDKPGYYIGGKTGTGQVILENGAYSDVKGETIASYVGFGGTEGELPEYVVMVKIWGKGKHLEGEKDAMPIFDDISNYLIDYLKIRPKA